MKLNYKMIGISISIIIIGLFRQLTWNNNCFNVDELGWLYLLERIKYNPLPFSGFTAHTSGPFSIYFLSIINLFIETPTLKSLRIFQFVICIIPSLIILNNSISKNGKWLGTFVLFLFFITTPEEYSEFYDFLAYNTEYQIMLFTCIIYYLQKEHQPGFLKIFFTGFLTISLFLVKSQTIIFVGYFNLIYFVQLFIINKRKSYLLILSTLLTLTLFYLLFKQLGVLEGFYYEYLYKNLLYSKIDKVDFISQLSSFIHFISSSIYFFWSLLFIILAIAIGLNWRNNIIQRLNPELIKSALFFIVSLLTIFISTNNFPHYKVLLFLPMSLLIGELAHVINIRTITTKAISIAVLSVVFFLFYSPFYLELLNKIKYNTLKEYQLNLGMNYLESPGYEYVNHRNSKSYKTERNQVLEYMKIQLSQNRKEENKIFILGWFVAQGYYKELLKFSRPISKSAQNQYLMDFFINKDWINYDKEEKNLIIELQNEKPIWIIDSEEILIHLKKFPINKYISTNYQIALKTESITVYKLIGEVK
jgi:hypothetical protein